MQSTLSDNHFHDEEAAYAYVEKRVWPEGPVCPHLRRRHRAHFQDGRQIDPHWGLQVLPVPQAIHREDRDHIRVLACAASPLAASDFPARVVQKGHQF